MNRRLFFGAASLVFAPTTVMSAHDPLADAIGEYQRQIELFAKIPDADFNKDSEDGLVASTYGPALNKLLHDTPQTTSLVGVRDAIKLAFKEDAFDCRMSENVLKSALAYLDRVTVQGMAAA